MYKNQHTTTHNSKALGARRVKGARRRKGAAVVEMAVISPLLLLLILGMIEMSRLGMVTQLLTTAAREGCRTAVIDGHTQADVQARVNAVLTGSGITVGTVHPTPDDWATADGGTAVTVTLSVPYNDVSWLPLPRFLGSANVTASATLSCERP